MHVGEANFRIIPDAGTIHLLDAMDAVDQEMMLLAEMLFHERPDLMHSAGMDLGGDLLLLSSMTVEPKFRGNRIGHTILKAILGTVARNTAMVILEAVPPLAEETPEEGSPEHVAATAALRRYWMDFGFEEAAGDYLYLEAASRLGSDGPSCPPASAFAEAVRNSRMRR
ncbi:hypothetical protein [Arthrobacter globiformis]|uniref:hypothetical protein n=1 Tax=Arthrobacter globiformis TaxID=1665 RepID=UPI00277D7359|nr:hypothetical protein [Arthrobacter globiformis]MDQ0864983.1 GNAT superfamily N-acetyltransferase [Arthrobacter globiformis]